MTTKYSMNMQSDRYGDWVEAKDYDQLEAEFDKFTAWANERIETLENELDQLRSYQVGV